MHLKKIADKEKGKISEDAIKLIARSSEGSVRDSVSLLDRALISQSINENKQIEEPDVRLMLGLADKSIVISLLKDLKTKQMHNTAHTVTQNRWSLERPK